MATAPNGYINYIVGSYVAVLDRADDPAGLQAAASANPPLSLTQIVGILLSSPEALAKYDYLRTPSITSPDTFINAIYQNSFGRNAEPAAITNGTAYINQFGVTAYVVLILTSAQGTDATTLQNRADVSYKFTTDTNTANILFTDTVAGNSSTIINTVTFDPATVTAANLATDQFVATSSGANGETFTLTTAIDNFQEGTVQNDTFIGDNSGAAATATVQAADQLNGGGGVDTFKYFGPNGVVPQLTDVETVQLIQDTSGTDLNFGTAKNLKNVTLVSPTKDITISGIAGVTLGAENDTSGKNVTGDFGGTVTSATFSIKDSTKVGDVTLTGAAIAAANIDATGKVNNINKLVTQAATKTLNVTGTGGLTITKQLEANITTIDASKNTGGFTVRPGDVDVTFTGGSGNDTVTFTKDNFTQKDILDGGAGDDKLVLSDKTLDANLTNAVNAVKNFETLGFAGNGATLDAGSITAVKNFEFSGAGNIAITNAANDNKFTVTVDNVANTFNLGDKTGQNTTNLVLTGGVDLGVTTFTGISTVNLASNGTAPNSILNLTATNPEGLTFVVTGSQDFKIDAKLVPVTKSGITIDGTALTGKLNATGTNPALPVLVGDIIKGGTGADTIAGLNGADILTGGGAKDTFVYNNVTNSNAGDLTLTGKNTFDTIADFNTADDLLNLTAASPNWVAGKYQGLVAIGAGAANLADAAATASLTIGANRLGSFQFSGNTYILGTDATVGAANINATDLLIQLTGLVTPVSTNFTA